VNSSFSELYHASSSGSGDDNSSYDPLNRLTSFSRGTLTASGNKGSSLDTITSGNLGNFKVTSTVTSTVSLAKVEYPDPLNWSGQHLLLKRRELHLQRPGPEAGHEKRASHRSPNLLHSNQLRG
jgi:hypothetical protein